MPSWEGRTRNQWTTSRFGVCREDFSHDDALAAAPSALIRILYAHLFVGSAVRSATRSTRASTGDLAVIFADLSYNVVKGVFDIDAGFGRCLDESASKVPSEFPALCCLRVSAFVCK